MIKHVNYMYKHYKYFCYVSMISFGYVKLTFNISMAFIPYDCRLWIYAHARFYHTFLRSTFKTVRLQK